MELNKNFQETQQTEKNQESLKRKYFELIDDTDDNIDF